MSEGGRGAWRQKIAEATRSAGLFRARARVGRIVGNWENNRGRRRIVFYPTFSFNKQSTCWG